MRDRYLHTMIECAQEDADRVYTALLEAIGASLNLCLNGDPQKADWLLCADLALTYTRLNDEIKRLEALP